MARAAAHDSDGPGNCRGQFDAAPVLPRNGTVTREPGNGVAPLRTSCDPAKGPKYALFGGRLRASVPGAFGQRIGDRTGSNRTHRSGAFAISCLRPGSPLECRFQQWRTASVIRRVLAGIAAETHLRCPLAATSAWDGLAHRQLP